MSSLLTVREMQPDEVDLRIDYFHDSSDEHLRVMGVDRNKLPTRQAWRESYQADFARPAEARLSYSLLWEVDATVVGFSTADRIEFGRTAFMHLHILEADDRRKGHGSEFVALSARTYFKVLELEQLFCEPNAFNVAPNRALQRAGFRFLYTHEATPGPLNFHQVTTRWALDRPQPFD